MKCDKCGNGKLKLFYEMSHQSNYSLWLTEFCQKELNVLVVDAIKNV